jgi:2-polyprenyl-6-hydroxyphenyl methylase/3-demethylubiquinone-9 3-methyltransferase
MDNLKGYYENYWHCDTDVSNSDVTTPERERRLLKKLSQYLKPGESVLDLGCGGGKFTKVIKEADYEAGGADISERALDLAKTQFPRGHFFLLNSDGTIPSPDETYAAVWCSEVIEHILNVNGFLLEIKRVLKPGGFLILTTPYHGVLKNLLIALFKFDEHFDPEGSHIRFFDRKGLERCLKKTGFIPISFEGIGRIWKIYRTWFIISRKAS